jgi:hypothetical protein
MKHHTLRHIAAHVAEGLSFDEGDILQILKYAFYDSFPELLKTAPILISGVLTAHVEKRLFEDPRTLEDGTDFIEKNKVILRASPALEKPFNLE